MAAPTNKTCFVICPIGTENSEIRDRADWVLHGIILPALSTRNIQIERADLIDVPGNISTQVVIKIQESDVVVADLTDHNPNVFYELAIRHCASKPVIHIAQIGTNLPFDINDHRTIFYDLRNPARVTQAAERLKAAYDECIKPDFSPSNPVSNAMALRSINTDKQAINIIERLQKENTELHQEKSRLTEALSQRDKLYDGASRRLGTLPAASPGILATLAGLDTDYMTRKYDLALSRLPEIDRMLTENKKIEDAIMLRQRAPQGSSRESIPNSDSAGPAGTKKS